MHLGATMWFTEYSISPSELAVALEERGFESLWASEHSHLPVAGNSEGGEMRNVQADVMDPFLTLTAAAMSTKRSDYAPASASLISVIRSRQRSSSPQSISFQAGAFCLV